MKDATLDPSVNAQKSDCFIWVYPCYSIYGVDRQKNNLKELRKFKTVFRSVLPLQKQKKKTHKKPLNKARGKVVLCSSSRLLHFLFNYQDENILPFYDEDILKRKGGNLLDSGLMKGFVTNSFHVYFIYIIYK